MTGRSRLFLRRAARWAGAVALAAMLSIGIAGCATKDNPDIVFEDTGAGEPQAPPTATVEINYAQKGDALARATVTKYFGAEVLANRQTHSGKMATIIRFSGGVPIWEVKADRSLAGRLTDIGAGNYAIKDLHFGKLPSHFVQVLPDEGAPEPLDRGGFYVFEIQRASGARNWEAVKILADGSLQAYAAQPRAGTSFILCCGIPSDFSEPVVVPEEVVPADSGDQGAPPDDSGN
jgi:hypothetical protein